MRMDGGDGASSLVSFSSSRQAQSEPRPPPQDFLVLVAAGNSGSEIKTIGAPATSKSCVAVGATENINALDDDDKLDSIDLARCAT